MSRWWLAALLASAPALLVACSGGADDANTASTSPKPDAIELDLSESWPIRYAKPESFKAFQTPGWLDLVRSRNIRTSAASLGEKAARPHAEAAALFRQAALVSANAAIETYAMTPQETDPIGASHLLAVGYALNGDLDKARAASKRLDGTNDVTAPWHGPWQTWLAGDAAWPPDLSSLPVEFPPTGPGKWAMVTGAPHYAMPVQAEGDHAQKMGDPGALVALALWHEKQAKSMVADPKSVDLYLARYRLPAEGPYTEGGMLTDEMLYASDFLSPGDAAFMADVLGEGGAAAVSKHTATSLLARLAEKSRVDGKVDSERAADVASAVRKHVLAESEKIQGKSEQHHRWFADIARVGILRNLALLAGVEGDRETDGKLRILASESSVEHASCSVALMSLAAWDARNRYPSRAQEFIHRHEKFYPSLEAARFGLDVLALRVSHERVETPGM